MTTARPVPRRSSPAGCVASPSADPDGPDADEGGDTVRLTAALGKVPSDAFAQIWCDDVTGPTETCANCAAVRTTVLDAFSGAPLSRRALDPSLAMSSMRQVTAGIPDGSL